MSVLSEINRIKSAVTDIVNAIKAKGVTVPTTAKIGDLAQLVSSIITPSGTKEITSAGTHDVTEYESVIVPVAAIATPSVIVSKHDDSSIAIKPTSRQSSSGYVSSGTKDGISDIVSLYVNGNTVTMECQGIEVQKEVGTSIKTCNVTITIADSVGYIGVTATTFANGAVGAFAQGKSSGTFTINNVVCGSAIAVMCTGYFSLDTSMNQSALGATSVCVTAPSTTGNYTAQIIAYED